MPLDPLRFREWISGTPSQNDSNKYAPKRSSKSTWIWINVFGVVVVGIIIVILLTHPPS